jgi:hypothetical protein
VSSTARRCAAALQQVRRRRVARASGSSGARCSRTPATSARSRASAARAPAATTSVAAFGSGITRRSLVAGCGEWGHAINPVRTRRGHEACRARSARLRRHPHLLPARS